jgi:glycosyltransferase involved in cell wall biosynthesis
MRILIVHDYGTLSGGAEIMVWRLRDSLRARGHEARLFTSTARPLPLPIVSDATCLGTVSPLRRLLKVANPDARLRLRDELASFRPDVVHVEMFTTQLSPLILSLLRGVPSVLHLINYNQVCPINTKTLPDGRPCRERPGVVCHTNRCMTWLGVARHAVERRLIDLSVFDRMIANSRWVAERLCAEGVPVDSCVYSGVAARPPRPPLHDPPLAAFAGRLIAKKGVDVLVRAMAAVLRRVPHARLIVAGDGPDRPGLVRLAEGLGILRSVDFVGHLDQEALERMLAPAWVQAVPSIWEEPFGLVAAEAMMRGTAVVATRPGGLTELVADGESGYLVPAGDVDALADALQRILLNREFAERLGQNGRTFALAELTEDRHVDRVLAIYGDLVSPAPNSAAPVSTPPLDTPDARER